MFTYISRRILLAIPVLFGILIVTFAIARLIPGDPCHSSLGERATPEACEAFDKRMGLDKPLVVQLGIYMNNVIQGDFGNSIRFSRPVSTILIERLPVTLELGITGLTIAIIVGVPLGIVSATRRNSFADVATMVWANVGVSMPVYWLGLMLAFLFAIKFKDTPFWLPPSGRLTAGVFSTPFYAVWGWTPPDGGLRETVYFFFSNFLILNSILVQEWNVLKDALVHLILPAGALSTIPMAIIARITRSAMLEVLGEDYVRTARAKGVGAWGVVLKHAFRNAMLPIVTIIGLQAGTLFAGAVLTESIFGFSGVGRGLYDAITGRDFPIIQGFTVVVAVGYVFINLITDISYAFIDPRIKLE
jgi:peptide/nickel transport system permease protein